MAHGPERNAKILLVDPDEGLRTLVSGTLAGAGYQVSTAASPPEAIAVLGRSAHDAVIVALSAHSDDGEVAVTEIRRQAGDPPILLMADPARVRQAVSILGGGSEDYLQRPPDPFELQARLERLLDRHSLQTRITYLQEQLSRKSAATRPEVRSPAMARALERVQRVAPMRSTVLIGGESGVGKELVARLIHFSSPRRDQPFIALNCAAIPTSLIESELFGHEKGAFTGAHARSRGKFELADKGTLFLDEIGDMDPSTQAKLLRVLEQKEFMRVGGDRSLRVDVRLIAATNAELESLVAQQRFRRDLYYRLKVVTIQVPPLRERRLDIPPLVETFLDELARANGVTRKTIDPEALLALQDYRWPGNVRELKNLIESLLVSMPGERIRVEDLPPSIRRERVEPGVAGLTAGTTLADVERELIRVTLEHTGGNRTHSASLLGIGVRTLQRKIRSYGIEVAPTRRRPRRRAPGVS
jgi:DNA-binding NtrC family response regulator